MVAGSNPAGGVIKTNVLHIDQKTASRRCMACANNGVGAPGGGAANARVYSSVVERLTADQQVRGSNPRAPLYLRKCDVEIIINSTPTRA